MMIKYRTAILVRQLVASEDGRKIPYPGGGVATKCGVQYDDQRLEIVSKVELPLKVEFNMMIKSRIQHYDQTA